MSLWSSDANQVSPNCPNNIYNEKIKSRILGCIKRSHLFSLFQLGIVLHSFLDFMILTRLASPPIRTSILVESGPHPYELIRPNSKCRHTGGCQHINLGADTNIQSITPFQGYNLLLPLWIPSWSTEIPSALHSSVDIYPVDQPCW